MTTYRAVFINGEKRELIIDADRVVENKNTMMFYKDKHVVAVIPRDKFLYITEVETTD